MLKPPTRSTSGSSGDASTGRKRKIALVAVPAASDLLATALAAIGIMYIPASVWQMLRGALVGFGTSRWWVLLRFTAQMCIVRYRKTCKNIGVFIN